MTRPDTFGGILRQYREAAGLTQKQLADAAGLSELSVIRYENDQRMPAGWDVVMKLCEVLGKRPNDFAPEPPPKRKKRK
jgi:transcriptional regulator with XRE-family HTH domain